MFGHCLNSKKKGDAGLGKAIAYFTLLGIPVCIPLTDSQDYDLVIEVDGNLQKVQVKTTDYKTRHGIFEVGLRVCGGNSKKNFVHKKADEIVYDILFCMTSVGTCYCIPKTDIAHIKAAICLGKNYDKYIVEGERTCCVVHE